MQNLATRLACLLALLGGLSLTSCQSTLPLLTPSGRPEVSLHGASRDHTMQVMVQQLTQVGYRLAWTDGGTAVFEREVNAFSTKVSSGAKWGSTPILRVTCRLLPNGNQLHAIASVEVIANLGTKKEKVKDYSQATEYAHEIQNCLEMVVGTVALQRHAREIERREKAEAGGLPVWTGQ